MAVYLVAAFSIMLNFMLIIWVIELYARVVKVQHIRRERRMEEIGRQIMAAIKNAVDGSKDINDYAYSRHEFLFDYTMDLRCYM